MFELHQVGERTYYIQSPAKIGLYDTGDGVLLIDSGNDKDAGRKVRKLLDERGWKLRAIVNTHANADHIGGNQYLQNQTGCPIFANGVEAAMTRSPMVEPAFLYGGYPPAPLRHKFLLAAPSDALEINSPGFPAELEPIPLPGHYFEMCGFRTPDDVVFLADALSSDATLEKYGVTFLYDVEAYLDTLARIETMQAALFVPSHAEATADIAPLARRNREKVLSIAHRLVELCAGPQSFEDLLASVFEAYGLTMNFEQHVLVGSTVRSYLAWLLDNGRLEALFENNRLLWRAIR